MKTEREEAMRGRALALSDARERASVRRFLVDEDGVTPARRRFDGVRD
jgi:hypothetical protein